MARPLQTGAEFSSFADFENALQKFQAANDVKMVKRDSKKIQDNGESQPDEAKIQDRNFPYRYAMYRCRYAGKPRRKAGAAQQRPWVENLQILL